MKTLQTVTENNYRNLSFWLNNIEQDIQYRAALQGHQTADVVIVGAGFSGLWTAYYLNQAKPDLNIAIVESRFAGAGASGRNGGWCSWHMTGFNELANNKKSKDQAKRLLPHLFDMVEEVGLVCQQENIDCDYQKDGLIQSANTRLQRKIALDEIKLLSQLGHDKDVYWLEQQQAQQHINLRGMRGASFTPHCAVVQPAKLAQGLAQVLQNKGVKIYEQSPVEHIQQGLVRCPQGSIKCESIIMATEGYGNALKPTQKRLYPTHGYVVVTEPLPQSVFDEINLKDRIAFGDCRLFVSFGQRTAGNRIAFGVGADNNMHPLPQDFFAKDEKPFKRVVQALYQLFPMLTPYKISQYWGGPMGAPRDFKNFSHYDPEEKIGWLGGLLGNGVAATNLLGHSMAHQVLKLDSEYRDLPLITAQGVKPLKDFKAWEPSPLPWLGGQAAFKTMHLIDRVDMALSS